MTGIAWTTGLLLGLAEASADVTAADLVIGTSAGAAVGAQIGTGRALEKLFALQSAEQSQELPAELDTAALAEIFGEMPTDGPTDVEMRKRIGAHALAASTVPEPARRAVIEARVGTDAWPSGEALRITAVDAASGELVVFDGSDGVGLVDAVAASCAVPGVWPPVTIGARRFIDGGIRSVTNADLAAGCEAVVVVLPLVGFGSVAMAAELTVLERAGARTVVLTADEQAADAMGPNPLDPARRPAAARAGRHQAAAFARHIREVVA